MSSSPDKHRANLSRQISASNSPSSSTMSDRHPDWWFTPDDLDEDDVEMANLLLDMREGRTMNELREAIEGSSGEEETEDTSQGSDEDNSGTYQPPPSSSAGPSTTAPAPTASSSSSVTTTTAATGTPASVLPQGQTWKYQQPMPQPLGYLIAADANGNERTRTYQHPVDFNDRASVNRANKARREEVYRARARYNLPLARESMAGREFTRTHFDWIAIAHEAYAILHEGRVIPFNILALWWRFCWQDGRTEQALGALESRNQDFKDLRRQYR